MREPTRPASMDVVRTDRAPDHQEYLDRLDAALVGPRSACRSLVAEAGDHLDDATDALVAAGLDEAEAGRRARADFGTVADVAPAYQEVLAVASARRTAGALLVVMAAQPFLWDRGLDLGARATGPAEVVGSPLYAVLDAAVETTGAVAVLGSLLLLLAAGAGQRWWPVAAPSLARVTGGFAVGCAVALSVVAASMTALAGASLAFWVLGTALVALPLALVARSARSTLATA